MAARDISSMSVNELKKAVTVHRGHLTRGWTDMKRIMQAIPPEEATIAILQNIQDIYNRIQHQRGIVLEMYQTIINLEPNDEKLADQKLAEFDAREDPEMDRYHKYLGKVPAEIQRLLAPTQTVERKERKTDRDKDKDPPNPNTTLKPDKLTLENSPIEYKHWTKRFRAFYQTSQLQKLGVQDQPEYLNNV